MIDHMNSTDTAQHTEHPETTLQPATHPATVVVQGYDLTPFVESVEQLGKQGQLGLKVALKASPFDHFEQNAAPLKKTDYERSRGGETDDNLAS